MIWNDALEFSSRLIHRWPSDDKHRSFRLEWASAHVAEKVGDLVTGDACRGILNGLINDPEGSSSRIMFQAYVFRIFREGGHTFELKDLRNGKLSQMTIPQQPDTIHFEVVSEGPSRLFTPKVRNYACADMLLSPRDLFQITVSSQHPVKEPPFANHMANIIEEKGWVSKPEEARLIFVVPSNVYDDFKEQNYLLSANVGPVKQYVLKIDLESAAAGKEPGLQVPAQSPPRNLNQSQATGRNRNHTQAPDRKQLHRKCKK